MRNSFWGAALGHLALTAAALAAAVVLSDAFSSVAASPLPSDFKNLFC